MVRSSAYGASMSSCIHALSPFASTTTCNGDGLSRPPGCELNEGILAGRKPPLPRLVVVIVVGADAGASAAAHDGARVAGVCGLLWRHARAVEARG